jgi:hypothetical protein
VGLAAVRDHPALQLSWHNHHIALQITNNMDLDLSVETSKYGLWSIYLPAAMWSTVYKFNIHQDPSLNHLLMPLILIYTISMSCFVTHDI